MIKKLVLSLIFTSCFFVSGWLPHIPTAYGEPPPYTFEEEDGDPSITFPVPIKFPNDSITDNPDGSISISFGAGDVTAAANIADHSIVRGDGGAKGIQGSGIDIDDSDNMTLPSGADLKAETTISTPEVDQNITAAGDTLSSSATHVQLNPNADYVMTSTPTIAAGVEGQLLIFENISAFDIDLQDDSVVAGSDVFLGRAEGTIAGGGVAYLFYTDDSGGGWRMLSNPNTATLGADATLMEVRNETGVSIAAGKPVYIVGYNVGQGRALVALADSDDSSKMLSIGIVALAIATGSNGDVITSGSAINIIDTSGQAVNAGVYIGTTAGELVYSRPTGATTAIQRIGTVARVHANNGVVIITGAGRQNAEENITEAYIFVGNANERPTGVAMSGDITIIANGTTTIGNDKVDSQHYNATSIDFEHLAADVINGASTVTPVSTDMLLLWDATDSALKKADASNFLAGAGDITDVGDCTSGACFDGTSDGGTYLDFYDAQGRTRLIGGNTAAVVTLTLPITTSTLIYSGGAFHDGFSDFVGDEHIPEGTIDHGSIAGRGDDDHTIYILHSLAGAANDFLVASGANTYVKKTLAETGAILEADIDHGNIQGLGDDDHSVYENELTNSAGLLAALDDETGTGLAVFGTSPTLVTPALGTPSAVVLTNATGIPSGAYVANSIDDDDILNSADVMSGSFGITIDGGGSAITTGVKGYIEIPYAMTIDTVIMLADVSGSAVVDIWLDSYANYPPTDADTITSSAVPTISGAIKSQDTTLTGWTTSVTAGDVVGFNVDSASTITRLHIIVSGNKL